MPARRRPRPFNPSMDASVSEAVRWSRGHGSWPGRWLLAACLAGGCGTVRDIYTVEPLPMVVRPSDEAWGVEMALDVTDAVHVGVANMSQEPVRLLWDECAYIDIDGESHRLVMARAARGQEPPPQVPTSVVPGSHVEQTLYPANARDGDRFDPLFPGRPAALRRPERFLRRLWPFGLTPPAHPAAGRQVSVFLVMERGGKKRTLTAPYRIAAVRRTRRWW